jgi:hypothetical protein
MKVIWKNPSEVVRLLYQLDRGAVWRDALSFMGIESFRSAAEGVANFRGFRITWRTK